MAFKRLVVHRSAGAVWFGVSGLVSLFALMRASYPPGYALRGMWTHGTWPLWLAGYAFAAYLVFRGLHGAWWRELRVDHEARTLKPMRGPVVSLDELGEITIKDRELRAEGVKHALYFSPFHHELEHLRVALNDLLRRGGRRRLYKFRRLTYHRSWGLFVFTLLCFAYLTGAVFAFIVFGGSDEIEYKLLATPAYGICFLWFRRALFGSFSNQQLFVDPTAGLVRLATAEIVQLESLGALSIEKTSRRSGRHTFAEWHLVAANRPGERLYSGDPERRTQERLDALATAVLQSALRRVLEAPMIDGDVYRGGFDPKQEAERIAGDSLYRRAALTALTHDPDPTVRERARGLLDNLTK